MSSLPRKSPRIKSGGVHQCPQCGKAYERPDHLARHLDSHRNARTFQCAVCLRGFNRRDVLQRHMAIHTEGKSFSKYGGRAIEACEDCAVAKVSCDNDRPCKRCRNKRIPCNPRRQRGQYDTPSSHRDTSLPRFHDGPIDEIDISPAMQERAITQNPSESPLAFPERTGSFGLPNSPALSGLPLNEPPLDHATAENQLDVFQDVHEYPAFFEQVMMSHSSSTATGRHEVQQPRGVFDFMHDFEFTSPEGGLFGDDILLNLERVLETDLSSPETNPTSTVGEQTTRQRVAAFKRSLWLWVPGKNQNGFSDEEQIPLEDGDMMASISALHRSRLEALNIRGKLTNQSRDEIFQLVIRTVGSRLAVPSFPTAESLDALIKIGISKRTETDAWIHPYTLYRPDSRPELLTALVAAGCVCCAIPSINKTGVLLLEIVRESLTRLVESDNSVLRDLQYFQASMIWLDIGVFCGYKRKMEIAESNLQPLCTALRRGGAFDRSFYSQDMPFADTDDEASMQKAWHEWIREESLKRLSYHLFEHDAEVAAAINRPALSSYAELTVPFPSSRELWLAPTAIAWRNLWTAKYSNTSAASLSLRDLLSDPSTLNNLPPNIDTGVVRSTLLHGLMSQAWEFRQQALLSENNPSESRALARLWLQSRRDDLSHTIRVTREDMPNSPPVAVLLSEFAMLYLHINLDSVRRFAGQFGESEARKEYPRLRDWSFTKEARISIWHAGQILRAARRVPPYQLRGFDNLAIYHAALTLWVFGLIQCGERERLYEESAHPNHAQDEPLIALDGQENEFTKAFISRSVGQPGLTFYTKDPESVGGETFCYLHSPRLVMEIVRQVFEGNFPDAADNLPPLVNNLRNLIRDLGSLP